MEEFITREELEEFSDNMRQVGTEMGLPSSILEQIIERVVQPDNTGLFHRPPREWIRRSLVCINPNTFINMDQIFEKS